MKLYLMLFKEQKLLLSIWVNSLYMIAIIYFVFYF